ncbi:bucentaur or craniofacial development-domain-containing protein [Russula aff. rugulosa BPL654]|nr:bucentaur or craniofacial development-domain-containing protein [Russula aff. rugulosa BPL654]
MVKIVKRHRFAGEDVVEIVDVPEDSADAKKWPLWSHQKARTKQRSTRKWSRYTDAIHRGTAIRTRTRSTAAVAAASASSSSSVPVPSSAQAQPLTTKRPIRRKPKLQLAELPSAGGSQKGKKLTTLEKSALDWKAHVDSSRTSGSPELASELEANRRGGGYLEKVEFLQRVGDRKGQAFEANKDQKRRRG